MHEIVKMMIMVKSSSSFLVLLNMRLNRSRNIKLHPKLFYLSELKIYLQETNALPIPTRFVFKRQQFWKHYCVCPQSFFFGLSEGASLQGY